MRHLKEIISKFKDKKIVVIGDVMLDKYIYGDVYRISPEAPIPIIKVEKEIYNLGAAANVAANIIMLNGQVVLFGFVGKDENGKIIKNLLEEKKIKYYFDENAQTTLKVRVIGKNQQLIRADYEELSPHYFNQDIKERIKKEAENSDIIIISDYAKGAITEDLMNFLERQKKKIIVDPKPKNRLLYKEVFLITPNEKEALEMSKEDEVYKAGQKLKEELKTNVLVTRGKDGMALFSDKEVNIPTYAREVYDVTGAGDTVISVLALALAANSSLEEAAIIANHSAGIVVGKAGTYQVRFDELYKKLSGEENKIKTIGELSYLISDLKRKDRKIVWTNGCFDLLHIGHIKYLQEAKKYGEVLVVGLNSDDSVRKIKGEGRPIQSENERAEILASLEFVDYIMIFPETSVEEYLNTLKPEVYVKGGDYKLEDINQKERKIVEDYKGKIVFVSLINGKSVSNIVEKIKNGR